MRVAGQPKHLDALTVDDDPGGVVRGERVEPLYVGHVAASGVQPMAARSLQVPQDEALVERDADGQCAAQKSHTWRRKWSR